MWPSFSTMQTPQMFRECRAIFEQANNFLSPDLYTTTEIKVCMELRKSKYSPQLWGLGAGSAVVDYTHSSMVNSTSLWASLFFSVKQTLEWQSEGKPLRLEWLTLSTHISVHLWQPGGSLPPRNIPGCPPHSMPVLPAWGGVEIRTHAALNKVCRNENGRPCKLPSGALEIRFSSVWMDGALLT